MVQLDRGLLIEARRLIDAANGHRLKEMILVYEQAVDLHNRQCPSHEIYRMQSELRLRKYVLDCQTENIRQRSTGAVEIAARAATKSITLAQNFDTLQREFEEWNRELNEAVA